MKHSSASKSSAVHPGPLGAAHRPVGGRVSNVRIDAAARSLERELDLAIAVRDEIEERVLKVREGEPEYARAR